MDDFRSNELVVIVRAIAIRQQCVHCTLTFPSIAT
jgi:hypothetical protein